MNDARGRMTDTTGVSIGLLADHLHLVSQVGHMRWAEWGRRPEPVELEYWVDITRREAGHDEMPVTWVAIDARGRAAGAVGIDEFDPEEFRDRSPWLVGMVVHPERRRQGIGSRLVRELEGWVAQRGFKHAWVATGPDGGPAHTFYRRCGWRTIDRFMTPTDELAVVLERRLQAWTNGTEDEA